MATGGGARPGARAFWAFGIVFLGGGGGGGGGGGAGDLQGVRRSDP
jgi:hypothetical protein